MPSQLTVGVNSYSTVAEADTYLDDSSRGEDWLGVSGEEKTRALISAFRQLEKQRYAGDPTGVTVATTIAVSAAGTGYAVDDILTISGGTFGEAAQIQVKTVGGGGEVQTLVILDGGTYSVEPSNPASTTGGGGTGCTLTLTFTAQTALFPRTGLTDCDAQAVATNIIPGEMTFAQIELAFNISVDSEVETSSGTGSNVKSAKAGSAEVEFFRGGVGDDGRTASRFPTEVHEYIRCFLGGSGTPGQAFGTDDCSQFDDGDKYTLNEGWS